MRCAELWGELPAGTGPRHVWGDCLVSLAKAGILAGSCISAVTGGALRVARGRRRPKGSRAP
ncbi:MAG: hypothetical protein H7287_12995 [Thermoleophilia bacterium]|nr:hypothetical protein [Thermoleophilia bacterium]